MHITVQIMIATMSTLLAAGGGRMLMKVAGAIRDAAKVISTVTDALGSVQSTLHALDARVTALEQQQRAAK